MSTPETEGTETRAESELPRTAQLILGADRRNPVFSVYRDSDREQLQVYFGFELIETLADVPENPASKLLVARLYNAGVKVKTLTEVFEADAKTIRRWGLALLRGNAEELIRVLEGRASRRKVTAPIEAFIRLRSQESAVGQYGGINQITSYRVIEYAQLRDQVKDRQVQSSQRKLLNQRRQKLRRKQASLLLVQEQAQEQQRQREQRAEQLKASAELSPEAARELKKIQLAQNRYIASSQTRRQQIQQWSQTLSQLDTEMEAAAKTESRLESLIAAEMVRMEPDSKRLHDALRILARNLFYRALQPFKTAYNNYRDDHDYFRKLSQSPGVLEFRESEVLVHLMPITTYAPALSRIVAGVLEKLNQAKMRLPNGAGGAGGSVRTLRFRLGSTSEIRLHVNLTQD